MYKVDNNGNYPDGDYLNNPWLSNISGDMFFSLRDTYGIAGNTWRCPLAPEPSKPYYLVPWYSNVIGGVITEDVAKTMAYSGRVSTSYQYIGSFPNANYSWEIKNDQNALSGQPVVGDRVSQSSGVTTANHLSESGLGEGNVGRVDGSATFVPADEFDVFYIYGTSWLFPDIE